MEHYMCGVDRNERVAENYHLLSFTIPAGHAAPQAGQFLTIRAQNGISPLLRRPFAFSAWDPHSRKASILYERRGRATDLLSAYEEGDMLDILAPLGNTFPRPEHGKRPILVGGGIGTGPILFLHAHFTELGLDPLLVVGARTGALLPPLPTDTVICTNDGSKGIKGTVIDGLESALGHQASAILPEWYACGPHGMMKGLNAWCSAHYPQSRCWVSLEQTMACAVGACMGCVVPLSHTRPYARVCAEGPVFDASIIKWE